MESIAARDIPYLWSQIPNPKSNFHLDGKYCYHYDTWELFGIVFPQKKKKKFFINKPGLGNTHIQPAPLPKSPNRADKTRPI